MPKEWKEGEVQRGRTGSSVWKTRRALAVSHYNQSASALAYIFTRKCPLPLFRFRRADIFCLGHRVLL